MPRSTRTSLFSLILGWGSSKALAVQRTTADYTSQLIQTQAKLTVTEKLWQLQEIASNAASTARDSYAKHFNRRVRQRPMFCRRELFYINNPPAVKAIERPLPERDSSRKLRPIKDGFYPGIIVRDHALTLDVHGIHNGTSTDKATLAKTGKKASASSALTSLTSTDEDLNTQECAPQSSRYGVS